MSVNAISSYSSRAIYNYFKSAIFESQLKTLLEKYGIKSSGNNDDDLRALYEVMPDSAIKEVIKAQFPQVVESKPNKPAAEAAAATQEQVPWANLMSQVGLSTSGNLETDYIAFGNQISLMKASAAASGQDKANIEQLLAQASVAFAMPMGQTFQPTAQVTKEENSSAKISGADILAKMNQAYFLKKVQV